MRLGPLGYHDSLSRTRALSDSGPTPYTMRTLPYLSSVYKRNERVVSVM